MLMQNGLAHKKSPRKGSGPRGAEDSVVSGSDWTIAHRRGRFRVDTNEANRRPCHLRFRGPQDRQRAVSVPVQARLRFGASELSHQESILAFPEVTCVTPLNAAGEYGIGRMGSRRFLSIV